jgi:hypothetical protein
MSCKSTANYYHGFDSTVESINLPLPDLPGHLFLPRHITTRSNSSTVPYGWTDRTLQLHFFRVRHSTAHHRFNTLYYTI